MDDVIDIIASVFHEAWMEWSKTLAYEEALSPKRLERWKTLWVPYDELRDRWKQEDRKFAERVVSRLAECGYVLYSAGK